MCGRVALHTPPQRLARIFDARLADDVDPDRPARYNLSPTEDALALVVRSGDPTVRLLESFRWGFVPHWAKDPSVGNRMINARGETLAASGAFADAFSRHRCLVVADGFYEWHRTAPGEPGRAGGGGRRRSTPYFFRRADGEPLLLAGLWSFWRAPHAEPGAPDEATITIRSCTIVTAPGNADVEAVHDRMPVIVERADMARWLDRGVTDVGEVADILGPAPAGTLVGHTVSPAVNNIRNDGPSLIEDWEEPAEESGDSQPEGPQGRERAAGRAGGGAAAVEQQLFGEDPER